MLLVLMLNTKSSKQLRLVIEGSVYNRVINIDH